MGENLKWYQRTSEILWAAVFAVVALIVFEALFYTVKNIAPNIDQYPVIKWSLFFSPWIVLFFIFYKYFKWKSKARYYEISTKQGEIAKAKTLELTSELSTKNQQLKDLQAKIQEYLKWDGIEQITGLDRYIRKLEGSGHHPRELLTTIERKLDFMGHGARKWTANKNKLADMLTTIAYNNDEGKARFLVINPLLETDRLSIKTAAESLWTLWKLQNEHKNLEVRIYEHIPQLRLTFYDDKFLVVGHYRGKEQKRSDYTPLLVFLPKCEWSFYKGFLSHFEAEWNKAKPIDNAFMVDKIEKLI
jgi:hypothetical protein